MMEPANAAGQPHASPQSGSSLFARAREIGTTVVVAMLLYWVLQAFVLGTYQVEGESMDDTLQNGQRMLVDKLTTRFDPYHRGDIVVLHPPGEPGSATPFIKRVIGVAGDHVEIHDGSVWLDGTELDEPYVRKGAVTDPTTGVDSWAVDTGEVLVMGDNRDHSQDSRMFGTVAVNEIIGRAWFSFWPLSTVGLVQSPDYPAIRSK